MQSNKQQRASTNSRVMLPTLSVTKLPGNLALTGLKGIPPDTKMEKLMQTMKKLLKHACITSSRLVVTK